MTVQEFITANGNYQPDEEGVYGKLGRALAAWRQAEDDLATIRREVGASELCQFAPPKTETCNALRDHPRHHHGDGVICTGKHGEYLLCHTYRSEPTIDAIRRVAAERLSDKACDRAAMAISDLIHVSESLTSAQIRSVIKQARGKGDQ